jgi:uncharacterized protein
VTTISNWLDAEAVIRLLQLQPHPEGGHYRETFRDAHTDAKGRPASTAIYFLLKAGEISRWHTVDATEIWNWYAGAPLRLSLAAPREPAKHLMLSADLEAGDLPQAVVAPHCWQQSQSLGAWSLVGCTVAPGFTFDGFRMAPPGHEPPFAS